MQAEAKLTLIDEAGTRVFGPGPAELLERVDELGSLSAASSAMGMAYSKALALVKGAEAELGLALIERRVGGPGGGGSTLSPDAREVLRRYRNLEAAQTQALAQNFSAAFAGFGSVKRLGCIVMAAGTGKRYGGAFPGAKLLARLGESSVLEHVLAAVMSAGLDVVVATRWPRVMRLCEQRGVSYVQVDGSDASDSLRAGLKALGERAGYVCVPGDQPAVSKESIEALLNRFAQCPTSVSRLAVSGRPGSPIVWPGQARQALIRIEGDTGGRALLSAAASSWHVELVEAAHPWELHDIDTPEDLLAVADAMGLVPAEPEEML